MILIILALCAVCCAGSVASSPISYFLRSDQWIATHQFQSLSRSPISIGDRSRFSSWKMILSCTERREINTINQQFPMMSFSWLCFGNSSNRFYRGWKIGRFSVLVSGHELVSYERSWSIDRWVLREILVRTFLQFPKISQHVWKSKNEWGSDFREKS